MTAAGTVAPMQHSVLRVASANGIMLPSNGLTHNQSTVLIGSSAALGPSVGQPILKTPAVGVFTLSSLHFGSESTIDSRANTPTSLRLKFVYSNAIRNAETVTLQIPLFSGISRPLLALTASTSMNASWDAVSFSLQLTFNDTLSAGTMAEVVVSETNGIVLPVRGVQANQTGITLATNAGDGTSSAIPVLITEPVGTFLVSSLDFVGAAATRSAKIVLSYSLTCQIQVGDAITLFLPRFYGTDVAMLNVSSLNFNASWSAASTLISMTATETLPADTVTVVKIEASTGIIPHRHGVAANDTSFKLATAAHLGPTLGLSLQKVTPIGAFLATEIDVTPKVATVAGIAVGIRVRFTLNIDLTVVAGEKIFVSLPGFRGHRNGTYQHSSN